MGNFQAIQWEYHAPSQGEVLVSTQWHLPLNAHLHSVVQDDPHHPKHGHKQVIAVAAALPVAPRSEGNQLHHHLHHKHQVQKGGHHSQGLGALLFLLPLYGKKGSLRQNVLVIQCVDFYLPI